MGGELAIGGEFTISLNNENHKFGWLRGMQNSLKQKKIFVAGACNHPNCLVLPFSAELIRLAA
jgi:hypothetical protein